MNNATTKNEAETMTKPELFTVSETAEIVKVAKFRSRINHLERLFHTDRHSCLGKSEIKQNAEMIQRIGTELIRTTCKTAKTSDWQRRENIIDSTETYLSKIILTEGK